MAEIKCPMCGKSNSEGVETCQHCQARIKPVFSDSHDNSGDDGSLDWLNELSGADSQNENKPPLVDDEKLEAQDWLSQIRQSSASEEPQPSEELPEDTSSEEEDVPGWMQGLMSDEEPAPAANAGGANWLDRFSSESESPEPLSESFSFSEDDEALPVQPPQQEQQNGDWEENLQNWQPQENSGWQQEPSQASAEQEYQSPSADGQENGDVPSWLQFLEEEMPEDQAPQTQAFEMPDENGSPFVSDEEPEGEDYSEITRQEDSQENDDLEIWLRSLDVDPQSLETRPASSVESVGPPSTDADSGGDLTDFSAFRIENGLGDEDTEHPLPSAED